MASHKVLKGVAHGLVGSFVGLLNYSHDDYAMGHVVQAAWLTGGTRIDLDLLTGIAAPSRLLVSAVAGSLEALTQRFPDIVERSGSSMDFVTNAAFRIRVDPSTRRSHNGGPLVESPFTCVAELTDDLGKVYRHELSDWWYPEHLEGEGYTASELSPVATNKRVQPTP